jgi:hypothetical protein
MHLPVRHLPAGGRGRLLLPPLLPLPLLLLLLWQAAGW